MPIYEYQCDGCSYKFEVKQSIKDDPLSTCERCGHSVRRLISSPGILFKGSGWYVTDYSDKLKPPSGSGGESAGGTSTGNKKPAADPAPSSSTASTPAAAPAPSTTTNSSSAASPTTTSSTDK